MIDEIKAINRYNTKRLDFVHYYRSGLTHLDSLYYLRGRIDTALYLESFHYERDPMFSTNTDFKVTKSQVYKSLSAYLKGGLEALEYVKTASADSLPSVRLTRQDSKTDLTELLYLLGSKRSFGNVRSRSWRPTSPTSSISDSIRIFRAGSAI